MPLRHASKNVKRYLEVTILVMKSYSIKIAGYMNSVTNIFQAML